MRKLLIIAVLGYLAYAYQQGEFKLPFLQADNTPVISNDNPAGLITITNASAPTFSNSSPIRSNSPAPSQYRCDGRQHCSQMHSYDEAVFFLRNCPNTKMDGDGNGIPCERQFGR